MLKGYRRCYVRSNSTGGVMRSIAAGKGEGAGSSPAPRFMSFKTIRYIIASYVLPPPLDRSGEFVTRRPQHKHPSMTTNRPHIFSFFSPHTHTRFFKSICKLTTRLLNAFIGQRFDWIAFYRALMVKSIRGYHTKYRRNLTKS